jgi:hypothetical protein
MYTHVSKCKNDKIKGGKKEADNPGSANQTPKLVEGTHSAGEALCVPAKPPPHCRWPPSGKEKPALLMRYVVSSCLLFARPRDSGTPSPAITEVPILPSTEESELLDSHSVTEEPPGCPPSQQETTVSPASCPTLICDSSHFSRSPGSRKQN